VTALEACVDDLTLDFVHHSLLIADQIRMESIPRAKVEDALMADKIRRCYICDAKTHLQHACPERPNNDQKKLARQMRHHKAQRVDQEESNDTALSTHHRVRNIYLPWIIDSGASRHMTMNKHMFCQ